MVESQRELPVGGQEKSSRRTVGEGYAQSVNEKSFAAEAQDRGDPDSDEKQYPSGLPLFLVTVALGLAIFTFGLDQTILATALPTITNEFHALNDVGWYGSAYLLATCATQFIYAKLYGQYQVKWVYIASIFILLIGSILCAAAPSSAVFILGRAIAGAGGAGIISGTLIIISHSVPLRVRPIYNGLAGSLQSIAIIIAPLIGGALTTAVTWRWCFWINLPIGGVTLAVLFFVFKNPPNQKISDDAPLAKLKQLCRADLVLLAGSVVALLLALQWGGIVYDWSSGRVIALIAVAVVAFAAFVGFQFWMGERATLPLRVLRNRTVALSLLYAFCTAGALNVFEYYLPLWFQAVKGASAAQSGVMLLPTILGLTIASLSAGLIVSWMGYYTPLMLLGTSLMALGFGSFTAFHADTSRSAWVGWQVAIGLGGGLAFSQPFTAVQIEVKESEVAIGMSAVVFANTLGGAVFISVAENIFLNLLRPGLSSISGFETSAIDEQGATELIKMLPKSQRTQAIAAYNDALTKVFWISTALVITQSFAAVGMKWNSVKKKTTIAEGSGASIS
ncbi:MFS toxin efflux pump [Xylariaceae sp. FL1272]|nr:MFS toxin efflux pump [Xylariaceae sp. FL1272]